MAVELNPLPSNSVNNINTNFQRVDEALQDAVSRSGTGPNQMNADFDMNSNDILNVGVIQAEDITIDNTNPAGILERALEAVEQSEANAEQAEVQANLSAQWANNPEDVPVEGGLYSSFHWAEKSADIYEDVLLAASFNPVVKQFTTTGVGPYNMEETIGVVNNLDVKIGGVLQDHNKYSIAGTTFTLLNNPGSGLEMEAIIRSGVRSVFAVPDDSINTSSLVNDAVTFNKLSNDVVDAINDDTVDLTQVYNAGYVKRIGNEIPTICLTFDFYAETSTVAFPIMSTYNLNGTFFVHPPTINASGPTRTNLINMKSQGWDIGIYTNDNWVTLEANNRVQLVDNLKSYVDTMAGFGLPVTSLAPNQRDWNLKLSRLIENYITHVRVANGFRDVQGAWQQLPVPNTKWIADGGTQSLSTADTGASLSAQVDDLISLGGLWQVVVHRVANSGDPNFRINTTDFTTFCAKIAAERTAGNLRVVRLCDL